MATIHISTPTQLQNMSADLTADYILDSDIDMSGYVWTPVGNAVTPFIGSFDGRGYKIKNLTISTNSLTSDYNGLFGIVGSYSGSNATHTPLIQNIIFQDCIMNTDFQAGLLAGWVDSGRIQNITVNNLIINMVGDTSNGIWIGGICGVLNGFHNSPSYMTNCRVNGLTFTNSVRFEVGGIGGLIGYMSFFNSDPDEIVVLNCSVTNANINLLCSSLVDEIGGLIGYADLTKISNCHFSGNISLDCNNNITAVGGLVGECYGPITNSYCSGNLTVNVDSRFSDIGGFIGLGIKSIGFIKLQQCFTEMNVTITGLEFTSGYEVGGFGGYLACPIANCYSRGNVSVNGVVNSVGGFIGSAGDQYTQIINCYSIGNVTILDGSREDIGGFIGYLDNAQIGNMLQNCYSVGEVNQVSDQNSTGGFIGYFTNAQYTNFHNNAWWTGSYPFPFGYFGAAIDMAALSRAFSGNISTPISPISPFYAGTDEEEKVNFYSKDHLVYAENF